MNNIFNKLKSFVDIINEKYNVFGSDIVNKLKACVDILTGKYNINENSYVCNSYITDELYLTDIAQKHKRNLLVSCVIIISLCILSTIPTLPPLKITSIFGFGIEPAISIDYIILFMLPIMVYETVMFAHETRESLKKYNNLSHSHSEFKMELPDKNILHQLSSDIQSTLAQINVALSDPSQLEKWSIQVEKSLTNVREVKLSMEQYKNHLDSLSPDTETNELYLSNSWHDRINSTLERVEREFDESKQKLDQLQSSIPKIEESMRGRINAVEIKFDKAQDEAVQLKDKMFNNSNSSILSLAVSVWIPFIVVAVTFYCLIP